MKFYTHVFKAFDKIYVRGYEDGVRFKDIVEYNPYIFLGAALYHNGNGFTPYKTLQGEPVYKFMCGSMKDAAKHINEYKNVEGYNIYGYGPESFHYQYINDAFPGEVDYDSSLISVVTLDIETDSEGGFPNIREADKALTAITIRKNDHAITFGLYDFVPELDYVTYIRCRSERDMIEKFLETWRSDEWLPDVVTGWNIEFFDIPYLINRITRLFDEKMAKRLSPWNLWEQRRDPSSDNMTEFMNIPAGISVLDYMQLYKKFSFTNQESFKLDHIAYIELGERKLDFTALGYETLDEFYKKDFQNYINYNIRDVDLVYKLDQKMKFLDQVYAIAYDGKVNMIDSLTTVSMWDVIIHNYLLKQNIVIPMKQKGEKPRQIEGAYVKDPQCGMHEWVVSFDLNSLYPHLIMQYNISPETMRGQLMQYDLSNTDKSVDMFINGEVDKVRQQLEDRNLTITPTGCLFDKTNRGFLPTLMEKMYDDRSLWKKRMIEAKKAFEANPSQKHENEVARCHNMQLAKKIQLNSAYGALSNQFFRWFDNRLAESITKSGQLSIRWMEKKINQELNRLLRCDNEDFVIAIDTDSMYIRLDKFVKKTFSDKPITKTVSYLDKVCSTYFEPFIDKCYQELADYMCAYDQKMKMKREAIANKGIWTGKKHYILNMYDLEGVRYNDPKLKIQGIESVRSSTPAICRDYLKKSFSIIMNKNETALLEFIHDFRQLYNGLPFEDIAFPRSVRGLLTKDQYDSRTKKLIQKSYNTGSINFLPSTPIHVKGSLMYNYLLKTKNLESKYVQIGEGEKIKFCYLLDSSPVPTNVIAAPSKLPKELGLDKYLDYETQFNKSFMEPLRTIINAIGWKDGNEQQTLDQFF